MLFRGLLVVVTMLRLVCAQTLAERARSLLEAKCTGCHGAARMSGLDLRTRETLIRGGKRGPAITLGNVGDSLLLKAVRRVGELQMPPGKAACGPKRSRYCGSGWRRWWRRGHLKRMRREGRRRRGGRSRRLSGPLYQRVMRRIRLIDSCWASCGRKGCGHWPRRTD